MKGVKDNGINRDVPKGLIIMQTINVKQPSLQPMIPIPHKKHAFGKKLKVRINKQKKLKSLIFKHPMLTPRKHVLFFKFLLPFPIER
jgi:hypothetical protein